ncbi:uncharacterized protein LOC112199119 [Rosa chinensis]|uniref:uncharacterized protein LOC112199119 n=1 Tax=Rosa chinensis TaxID=74649 RepID=UPI001AD8BA7D|nr:uncharacterized protein LOC112199119 [Rosa chinensis]
MSEMGSSLKRGSGDIGWEYAELADASNLDRLKCKLCGKLVSGGIYRMKQHIAHIKGNVAPCKKRMPRTLGPMDRFATPIDPDSSLDGSRKMRQQNINDALFKQRTHSPLLKEEVERTKSLLKKQEEEWALNGCSIMTDAWSDWKRRSIMNLCVNYAEGTTFLSSKEASDEAHTGTYIFEYVDKCIEDVGPQNVVQVVTDNASNNMAAGDLMKLKRPNIFWTSCATHTLNLMLQGIGNQPRFKGVIERAKSFTIYIYAHHKTLALMRKFTKKRDIVRPGVTRFATAFLTLQSLMKKKNELRAMITSDEWNESKHAKSVKRKAAVNIALSASFWNGVSLCPFSQGASPC